MNYLKELLDWWNHPVTEALFATIGAAVLLGGIRHAARSAADARACADDAHDRIDALESALPPRSA